MDPRLQRLIAKRGQVAEAREQLINKRKAIVDVAEDEARTDLSTEEDTEFRELTKKVTEHDAELSGLDERIQELNAEEERSSALTEGAAAVRRAQARAQVTEGKTYERGVRRSYFHDLARVQANQDIDGQAGERLRRHAVDVATSPEYRALDRTDGNGGYAVPPAWLMSQYVDLARAGRAYANVVKSEPLPGNTDSINVPKLATGTAVGVQDGDNTQVTEVDLTDTTVSAPVRTIAGQQTVALQLLDQSAVSFDEIIFRDLAADYAQKVNAQVIAGTGANGQVLGVRETSGIQTIAYTDASPTVGELYAKIADAIQRIHVNRFLPPTVIVMSPRRWAWFLAAVDTTGRPLVVPNSGNPSNAIGTLGEVAAGQVVGQMHGLPVVTDPGMPLTLGAGTNEDVIHVLRASDLVLYESGLRTRALPEIKANTLSVVLQVYGYVAFSAGRYPKSVVEIGGTGLAAPTF